MLDWLKKETTVVPYSRLEATLLELSLKYKPSVVLKPWRVFQDATYVVKVWLDFNSMSYAISVGEQIKDD